MSLVICSNRENDVGNADSSIFEPWSFRNGLSSTYDIPTNAQVGLHSCKVNLNGTMTLSGNEMLNQYYGEFLKDNGGSTVPAGAFAIGTTYRILVVSDTDFTLIGASASTIGIVFVATGVGIGTGTADVVGLSTIDESTSMPIETPMSEIQRQAGRASRFNDYDTAGMATLLQSKMNQYIYHPNLRDKVNVDVLVDPTDGSFDGYDFEYGQYHDETTSTLPVTSQVWSLNAKDEFQTVNGVDMEVGRENYESGVFVGKASNFPETPPATLSFSYAAGVFTGLADAEGGQNAMISSSLPLSLYNGVFEVDISNINASGLDWTVGLSRFNPDPGPADSYAPADFDYTRGVDGIDNLFFDYAVRAHAGGLYLQHTVKNTNPAFDGTTDPNALFKLDLDYWTIAGSTFGGRYDIASNTSGFNKVRFKARGQQLQVDMMVDAVATNVYTYDATLTKDLQLKPINQSCWCLHPVLAMETNAVNHTNTMTIDTFAGCKDIVKYGWYPRGDLFHATDFMGWSEYITGRVVDSYQVDELESRYWLDQFDITSGPNSNGQATYAGLPTLEGNRRIGYQDTTGAIEAGFQNVLIPGPSSLYSADRGNMVAKLGFNKNYISEFVPVGLGALDLGVRFSSDFVPVFKSGQSIFVRLDNFNQHALNGFKGNNSSIIAHLPRFDGQSETGRKYYQPSEIAWVNLNNPHPMKVSSFDISFCYVNEQYVKALTGQSIVVLMFRPDPAK